MTEYYRDSLEAGEEYQDFIQREYLKKRGILIGLNSSKHSQNKIGESLTGYEIKYDRRLKDTENVYIEYAEKTDKNNTYFVNSGILRKDNTWMYIIGDYERALVIPKNILKKLYYLFMNDEKRRKALENQGCREICKDTSKGIVFPFDLMLEKGYAADALYFNENKK